MKKGSNSPGSTFGSSYHYKNKKSSAIATPLILSFMHVILPEHGIQRSEDTADDHGTHYKTR